MLFLVDTGELLKKQPLFHDWILSAEGLGYLFVYLFFLVVVVVVSSYLRPREKLKNGS
jgi:Na+-transporting methylmalonyl-CoA/oxaloacetate decarboxylase gamma subunit